MSPSEINFKSFITSRNMKKSETDVKFGSIFAYLFNFTTFLFSVDFTVFCLPDVF